LKPLVPVAQLQRQLVELLRPVYLMVRDQAY
jgi:hypothetical protein